MVIQSRPVVATRARMSAAELRESFAGGYVAFHTPRYLSLLELVDELVAPGSRSWTSAIRR